MDNESNEVTADEYDTYHREKEFIDEITAKYHVLIFSKSWCPFCKKLKALFTSNNISFNALELDNHSNGPNIQDALGEKTGGPKTVPVVYICKKFRGGYNEIYAAWADGSLDEWLKCKDTDFPYDLVVIGGGSGGIAVAKESAKLGKSVALCDYVAPTPHGASWGLGGTCTNVGCIPKKLMHRATLIYHDIQDAECFGWECGPPEFHNWELMIEKIQEHIRSLNWDYKKQLRELGVAYFNGQAMLSDNHSVNVKDKNGKLSLLQAKTIVIATGARPMYLDAIGAEKYCITSDDLFSLREPPGRVLIIGGGYIALESASFLTAFGSAVKILIRKVMLRGMDQDMVEKISVHLEARGIEIIYGAIAIQFSQDPNSRQIVVDGVTAEGAHFREKFDTILLAIGRCPNTENLGLEKIGVKLDSHTHKIIVNKREQTSVSNIFAIGDCRYGAPELTPVSAKAGKLLAQRLYKFSETLLDYTLIPTTVFTAMEYAFVGETEEHAKKIHGDAVEVYHNLFQPYESVLSNRFDSRSYVKLICVKIPAEGEKIIGLHILGPNAGEMVQGYALAIKVGATKEHLDSLVGVHPTSAEIITTLSITKRSGEEIGNKGC